MNEAPARTDNRRRVLIVEDEWPARVYLTELLLATREADVVAALATAEEARQALGPNGVAVDLAFIDINLATSGGPAAGLALMRDFAGRERGPQLVLATALPEHALAAFEAGVVDYLLKPFTEERVRQCLARVRPRLGQPAVAPGPTRVVARSRKGLIFLRPEEVWAFEARERLTCVHAAVGRFDVDLSLTALEATLGMGFQRVHRNWLVNLEQVRALERDPGGMLLVLGGPGADDGQTVRVPVARDRAQIVRDALTAGATGVRRP